MTDIKGALRITHDEQGSGVNTPGVTHLADDEFTAAWMDPDGAIAKKFAKDTDEARALFVEAKRKAHAKRSTRRK